MSRSHLVSGISFALCLAVVAAGAQTLPGTRNEPIDPTEAPSVVVSDGATEAFHRFRWYGEQSFYRIEMWGSEAARGGLAVGYPQEDPTFGTVIPLQVLGMSTGIFDAIYPIHDTAITYLRPWDVHPFWSRKELQERDVDRTYTVRYRGHDFLADVERTQASGTRRYRRFVPTDIHDAFSWMMEARGEDLSVGREYVYYIFDGWKLSRLTARITRHTQAWCGLGTLDAAEFRFTREVLASHEPLPWADSIVALPPVYTLTDGPIDLGRGWVSTDDRRILIGVELNAPQPIGAVSVVLDRWEPPDPDYAPDPAIGRVPDDADGRGEGEGSGAELETGDDTPFNSLFQ